MSKKILVVEDEKNIAELERDYLEANGYTVEIEFDGKSGLDKALGSDYDLVILDVMLPGMTASRSVARYASTRSSQCSWSRRRRTR